MIFVNGLAVFPQSSSSSSSPSSPQTQGQGCEDTLEALLDDPFLECASNAFKAIPASKLSASQDNTRWVYLFQREYATVDPAFVHLVGTDEATTCIGLAIWNPENGMTSVAHLDSPNVVDIGLSQMLSSLTHHNKDVELDVHLVGGFEDVSPTHGNYNPRPENQAKLDGYSFPLVAKIVDTLCKRRERFHIRTLCILRHNTRRDPEGNAHPIFHGFMISTSTGSIIPASFDESSRCPDEIVRRIRVSASYEDSAWKGRLLETYETQTDLFKIAPCCWTLRQLHIALSLQNYSDSEILLMCSTSPSAEAPDFVKNLRRGWDYLIEYPDWRETFPMKQPRVFERTAQGGWKSKTGPIH